MTIANLLVGKRVKATEDCSGAIAGKIYVVRQDNIGNLAIGDGDGVKIGSGCTCVSSWELLDEINFTPKPHEHSFKCECGEIKK